MKNVTFLLDNISRVLSGAFVFISACILSAICVSHVLQPEWLEIFLYDGDSLVLAMLAKSIINHEKFNWVLSSQLFIFPEGLLYALCYLFSPSIQFSFILNGFLNFFFLVTLVASVGKLVGLDYRKNLWFILIFATFITICAILEPNPLATPAPLVTYFLFNTYYFGVILSSLLSLCLYLHLINLSDDENQLWDILKKHKKIAFFGSMVAGLTYASDPLYLIQCSIPLIGSSLLLCKLKSINKSLSIFLVAIQGVGLFLGQSLRWYFSNAIGKSVIGYIGHPKKISAVILSYLDGLDSISSSLPAIIKFLLIFLLVLLSLFMLIFWWINLANKDLKPIFKGRQAIALFLSSFALLGPIVTILATIAASNSKMRYCLPLVFYPPLCIALLIGIKTNLKENFITRFSPLILIIFSCLIPWGIFFLKQRLANNYVPITKIFDSQKIHTTKSIECINQNFRDQRVNLIGGFWTTRPLNLYTSAPITILQVNKDLRPFFWMNNKALYRNIAIDGIIVEKYNDPHFILEGHAFNHLDNNGLTIGEDYSKKIDCEIFWVYLYPSGSIGYRAINDAVLK